MSSRSSSNKTGPVVFRGLLVSREDIRKNAEKAQDEIDLILNQEEITYPFLRDHLRRFVQIQYHLSPLDLEETDDLDKLTLISLSKALHVSRELIADYEAGQNCEGATSATVKRSLLLMKIQKALSVELSLQELMGIDTLEDVVHAVWAHLRVPGEVSQR